MNLLPERPATHEGLKWNPEPHGAGISGGSFKAQFTVVRIHCFSTASQFVALRVSTI